MTKQYLVTYYSIKVPEVAGKKKVSIVKAIDPTQARKHVRDQERKKGRQIQVVEVKEMEHNV